MNEELGNLLQLTSHFGYFKMIKNKSRNCRRRYFHPYGFLKSSLGIFSYFQLLLFSLIKKTMNIQFLSLIEARKQSF